MSERRTSSASPGLPAELPRVYCPCCKSGFEIDDCYDIDEGSERACAKCGVMLECIEAEIIKTCRWQRAEE